MLHFAYRLDELGKSVEDFPALQKYTKEYGLSKNDIGIYALKEHKIAGAAWIRLLNEKPTLTMALKPDLRAQGVGSQMLSQLLLEAATMYEQIFVTLVKGSRAQSFYEKFGFEVVEASDAFSEVDNSAVLSMIKKLEVKELIRPNDGYDPRKWMD